jgi:hypothetical protein
MSQTNQTTNYNKVNVNELSFTAIEENQRSKGQKIAYPRYNDPQLGEGNHLYIQFPWIHLSQYGIPKLGEFYSDDTQRSFIKLPLDQSISDVKAFSEVLKDIDAKLGSDEFKKKMFGPKGDKYVYQPIFRLPLEEDDSVPKPKDKKDYGPKQPYMKLKLDTTYPDSKIKTIVYNSVMENEKRVRTKLDNINSVDDMITNIPFLSRIRPIGKPVKLWAQAPNKKDPTYGLTFKMVKVEVEPPVNKNANYKKFIDSDAFLDSDDEDTSVKTITKSVAIASVESESESDSDEEVKPAKKQTVATVSDDESDEEVVQPVRKAASKVVEVASDSDSDTVKPIKKTPIKASRTKKAAN